MRDRFKKGKNGLLNIIFSRSFLFGMMILGQVFLGMQMFLNVSSKYNFANVIIYTITLLLVICIVSEQKTDPTIKMLWSVLILSVPILGTLLYLYVKTQFGYRIIRRRIEKINALTSGYLDTNTEVYDNLKKVNYGLYSLSKYLYDYSGYTMNCGNEVTYLSNGSDKLESLLKDIEKAKKYIFLEYFIIEEGVVWNKVLDALIRKRKQGVEIRVMYDGMCSLIQLPAGYYKKLNKLGIKSKPFAPMRPFFSTKQNNRDHRKIAVIDGKIAYTGGINLADEYMNIKERFGYWKDSAVRIEGEAVKNFTLMFLKMWNMEEIQIEPIKKYLKVNKHSTDERKGFVVGFSDEPFDYENVGEQVYLHIINSSKRYVHIITPYLVIDNLMMSALTFAAKRGVDVSLVLPGIPDKKYAYCVARTYYEELMEAGVKIYEFTPGFTHSKIIVSDDIVASVGTINFDYRSFYLHFECGTLICYNPAIKEIENDFNNVLSESRRVTLIECKKRPLGYKIAGKILRLIAPLL